MKKKKYVIGFLFLLLFSASASAQVTLEQCYDSARANYPVIRQFDLLERTEQFTLEDIKRSFLPQLNLSARASWQSDVTKLPFEMPGMNIDWMEQDQYQFVLELKQLVYDGGMVRARREWQKARTAADRQQAEVELYALHQRIDQVYFGILLQNAPNTARSSVPTPRSMVQITSSVIFAFWRGGFSTLGFAGCAAFFSAFLRLRSARHARNFAFSLPVKPLGSSAGRGVPALGIGTPEKLCPVPRPLR